MEIYLVGGAVRDKYLHRPIADRDWVVVGANAQYMLDAGFMPVGKNFPVFLHPESHEEYALARTERKVAAGYNGFQFFTDTNVTLEQDLQRRDLTINAMAEDADGHLIDPYHGLQDLHAGVLRHVSPAFAEDPVRILRVARFAARYGFQVADETMHLMKEMVLNGEVKALVSERVWQELAKGLMESKPIYMFEILRACGALKVLLPEIDALFGVPQPDRYHPEIDSGIHTLMTLQYAADHQYTLSERFGCLVHDLGKACTPTAKWPKHHGHDLAGIKPLKEISQRLNIPKECQDLGRLACQFHIRLHILSELKPSTILKILKETDAFRRSGRFKSLLKICLADARGRLGMENVNYPQQKQWLEFLNAAQTINIAEIVGLCQDKTRIAAAIDNARLKKITQLHRIFHRNPEAGEI